MTCATDTPGQTTYATRTTGWGTALTQPLQKACRLWTRRPGADHLLDLGELTVGQSVSETVPTALPVPPEAVLPRTQRSVSGIVALAARTGVGVGVAQRGRG